MIAIPNMSKPKSCEECPIKIGESVGVYYDSKSDEFKRVKITGCNESKYHTKTLGEGYKMMYNDCPLIEIVTCGECKYANCLTEDTDVKCMMTQLFMDKSDFCSCGKRRNNENGIMDNSNM